MASQNVVLWVVYSLLLLSSSVSARNLAAAREEHDSVPNEILVKQPENDPKFVAMSVDPAQTDPNAWLKVLQEDGGVVDTYEVQFVDSFNKGGWARYKHTKGNTDEIIDKLTKLGVTAEKNFLLQGFATQPSDTDYSKVAGSLDKISVPNAWSSGATGSKKVKVCVIDSGVQFDHPDLAANVDQSASMDAILGNDKAGAAEDDAGHGTHIAGIIGAVGNNNQGIVGVQWNADILACRFMRGTNNGPVGTTSDAAKCIDWCRENGAKITSNSYGSTVESKALEDAVAKAQESGMIFVAAAGNDGSDIDNGKVVYPAGYTNDNIISVGNSNSDDGLGTLTNWGKTSVDLFAPGTGIYSTWLNGTYKEMTGTSMATPFVAGAAALIWSDCPKLTAAQVRSVILQGVDKVTTLDGKCTTGGRLNVDNSLQLAWGLDDSCASRPKDFKPNDVQAQGAWGDWSNPSPDSSDNNGPAPTTGSSSQAQSENDPMAAAQAVEDGSQGVADAAQASQVGTRQTIAQGQHNGQNPLPTAEFQRRRVPRRQHKDTSGRKLL